MDGTIPDAAIERAREMSGFYRAEFVEKDFADEDDIERMITAPGLESTAVE